MSKIKWFCKKHDKTWNQLAFREWRANVGLVQLSAYKYNETILLEGHIDHLLCFEKEYSSVADAMADAKQQALSWWKKQLERMKKSQGWA